eukprot:g18694.t1
MENVINNAIQQRLLNNNLLSDTQFVFRQGHSTQELITALVETWTTELNSRAPFSTPQILKQFVFEYNKIWTISRLGLTSD